MVQNFEETSLSLFPFWEMSIPDIPSRSRLYGLTPLGLNSPFIESLTSYMCRLACEHHVEVGKLIRHIIAPVIPKQYIAGGQSRNISSFLRYATPINGNGVMASDWSDALALLTLRNDLSQLTLLVGTDALSHRDLLQPGRQWCSSCYDEWLHQGVTIYDPLLWSINGVIVCPKHKLRLERSCSHCASHLPWLAWYARPGCCSVCGGWLGGGKGSDQIEEKDIYIAEMVGNFLVYTSQLSQPIPRAGFIQSLRDLIAVATEGNIAAFSRRLALSKTSMWELVQGRFPPSLPFLFQICLQFRLPLLQVFVGLDNNVSGNTALSKGEKQKSRRIFEYEKVRQVLEDILTNQQGSSLSMHEVAQQLGYPARTITTHFPEYSHKISHQHAEYLRQQGELRKAHLRQRVYDAATIVYKQGFDPTYRRVGTVLGTPGCFREYEARYALLDIRDQIDNKAIPANMIELRDDVK